MSKLKVTSYKALEETQISKETAMTPSERIELGFRLHRLANEIMQNKKVLEKEVSNIQWIILPEISI